MKNYKFPLVALFMAIAMWGCQKEAPMLFEDVNRISFVDSLTRTYSFGYDAQSVTRATIKIEVNTIGAIVDHDRTVKIVQRAATGLDETMIDARQGVHFEFPEEEWIVKAGANTAELPITLLRHSDLRDKTVVLRIALAADSDFELGDVIALEKNIEFSDRLLKPDFWDETNVYSPMYMNLGFWSENKERFMYQVIGMPIDEAWYLAVNDDGNLLAHYVSIIRAALDDYNATNPPLEDGKGRPIQFSNGGF